jgi:SAM-dependent methyltransferase
MKETSKAVFRRLFDARFVHTYFVGQGIDIGSGSDSLNQYTAKFPLVTSIKSWDVQDGDAVYMAGIRDETYNFVHSSHCLEHLSDPYKAFQNWLRICRSGGHIIVTIPDEDLYEQGHHPSLFTGEHLTTWTIGKKKSWSPNSINLIEFLSTFISQIEILKIELINNLYPYNSDLQDHTLNSLNESAIEFIVRKKTEKELKANGRYPG